MVPILLGHTILFSYYSVFVTVNMTLIVITILTPTMNRVNVTLASASITRYMTWRHIESPKKTSHKDQSLTAWKHWKLLNLTHKIVEIAHHFKLGSVAFQPSSNRVIGCLLVIVLHCQILWLTIYHSNQQLMSAISINKTARQRWSFEASR